jgi:hypothetical protein
MAWSSQSKTPHSPIAGGLQTIARLLGDLVEAVIEAKALAERGEMNNAIARLEGFEASLSDARDICCGLLD